MNALFTRWLPCATLSLWGLVMLYFAEAQGTALKWIAGWSHLFTGRVDSFLIPAFRPLVLAAGLVLMLMALLYVLFPANAECCSTADCAHPLSRFAGGKWLTFLILVVPVAVSATFSPDAFSKTTINNRGVIADASALPERKASPAAADTAAAAANSSTALSLPLPTADGSAPATAPAASTASTPAPVDPKDFLERTPEGYAKAEVLDMLYAAQDPMLRKVYEGETVVLIGQLMPDAANKSETAHRFKAVRMFMTCCAADARPVSTLAEAAKAPAFPEMTWIKITGHATFPVENGRRTAVIQAEKVEKTEPPTESMLY